jgi:hypothetical protein
MGKIEEAIATWLNGFEYYPERLEGMYEILKHYRINSQHKLGHMIYQQAKQILDLNKNRDGYLFLHNDVYTSQIYYEFSIIAFYVGIGRTSYEDSATFAQLFCVTGQDNCGPTLSPPIPTTTVQYQLTDDSNSCLGTNTSFPCPGGWNSSCPVFLTQCTDNSSVWIEYDDMSGKIESKLHRGICLNIDCNSCSEHTVVKIIDCDSASGAAYDFALVCCVCLCLCASSDYDSASVLRCLFEQGTFDFNEEMVMLCLNRRNEILHYCNISKGGVNGIILPNIETKKSGC